MAIDVNPTADELRTLHDDLKSYEIQLATYLSTPVGEADPTYTALAKADIQLNVQIYNLSIAQLQMTGVNAGAAVDSINAATNRLGAVIAAQAKIAADLKVVQSVVSFVVAVLSENPSSIVTAGGTLISSLQA